MVNTARDEKIVPWLVARCSSFVQLRKGIVQFVHQSARDHLSGENGQSPLDSSTSYEHLELAMDCLSRLNRDLKANLPDLTGTEPALTSCDTLPMSITNITKHRRNAWEAASIGSTPDPFDFAPDIKEHMQREFPNDLLIALALDPDYRTEIG